MNGIAFEIQEKRKTVISRKGIESIDLSLVVKCQNAEFVEAVEQLAEVLTDIDLEKVKRISIDIQNLE